jgi:hypothetical protein
MEQLKGLLTGAGKGMGETAVGAGRMVRATPAGYLTDAVAKLVGPEGTDPEAAFAQSNTQMGLGADNPAESVGKFAEQLAEMIYGGGIVKKGVQNATFKALPAASSAIRLPASISAPLVHTAAPIAAEGLNVGANVAMHGDENPGVPAAIGAAGPAVGGALSAAAPALGNPFVQALAAVFGGSSLGGMLGGGGGLGAYMAFQPAIRATIKKLMQDPTAVAVARRLATQGVPALTRAGAVGVSRSRQE